MCPLADTSRESLMAALCADIVREAQAAAEYLKLARAGSRERGTCLRRQAAECAALAHYRGRLAMAHRAGLVRLQERFSEIVVIKQRHLAHVRVLAAAGASPPVHPTHRERFHAHRSTHQ